MSLTRITKLAQARQFIVYDLEWVPRSLRVRTVGVYDGQRFRRYATVEAFIQRELTSSNRGKWFYAHFGGGSDLQFVLHTIHTLHPDISATGSFSGASLIICHIKRRNNVWHFLDSYWLLRAPLAKIGEALGMAKTGPDKETEDARKWYATVADDELHPYNEQDCRILWHAINSFENVVLDLGGVLQMTLASTAMTLFRRQYLSREIVTCDAVNDLARGAYIASRVEVFERECSSAYYYDVNSSFPYAMTAPLPGAFKEYHTRLTDRLLRDENPCLIRARIEVPEAYLPPLPYRTRSASRIYFPVGVWEEWFTNIDMAVLLENGGRIIKASEILEFEPFTDMAAYVATIYAARKAATSEFESMTFKLLLNTLYGKTAEMSTKSRLLLNPSENQLEQLQRPDPDCPTCKGRGTYHKAPCLCTMRYYRGPGLWAQEFEVGVPHVHVPIAAQVTAIARRTLYNHLVASAEVYYCDTDGFATSDTYEESSIVGGLKLEKIVDAGLFIAPKVYRLQARLKREGIWKPELILKAKGFSLGKNREVAAKRFSDLAAGMEVEIERMARIRENLQHGTLQPKESIITKKVHLDGDTKRYFYPDGSSRPWSIDELG